jgi:hypothetical protein
MRENCPSLLRILVAFPTVAANLARGRFRQPQPWTKLVASIPTVRVENRRGMLGPTTPASNLRLTWVRITPPYRPLAIYLRVGRDSIGLFCLTVKITGVVLFRLQLPHVRRFSTIQRFRSTIHRSVSLSPTPTPISHQAR